MQRQHAIDRSDQPARHTGMGVPSQARRSEFTELRSGRQQHAVQRMQTRTTVSSESSLYTSATTTSEKVEYRLGGRLVEIHIYSTKSHTYSTSTYYEAKNSSQFFWLAEWYVRSANMVDSSFRYPDETSTAKNNPSGRTHEVRMGQQQYDSCTSAQLYVRVQ